ncbi:MAG: PrsW family intramembrane metalloprotease [Planctomycetes bacterium]|jgi:RsiW-degrading membrane proteinase PrsW (M82 family)|nr:PrsW family intramembrane metalloprotease [Planctomycetota bacterium]
MEYIWYLFLGIAPALFFVCLIYHKDKFQPEPKVQIVKIFFLGILAIVPTAIIEWILQHKVFNIQMYEITTLLSVNIVACFIIIAPIEEFFKYSVVKKFVYNTEYFDEKIDGVVYMIASAMGFAALENVMYIVNSVVPTWTGILRSISATPAHVIFSGFMGIYLGRARFETSACKSVIRIVQGLLVATVLHGTYNFLAYLNNFWTLLIIPFLLVFGVILIVKVNALAKESKENQGIKEDQEIEEDQEADEKVKPIL